METKKQNYFYDIHCHTFNLSHAGLMSFLNRFFLENTLSFNDLLNGNIFQIILQVLFNKATGKRPVSKILKWLSIGLVVIIAAAFITASVFILVYVVKKFLLGQVVEFDFVLEWAIKIIAFLVAILLVFLIYKLLVILKGTVSRKGKVAKTLSSTVNVLSVFENDLGRQLRFMELDYISMVPAVKKKIQEISGKYSSDFYTTIKKEWNDHGASFKVGSRYYDRVILTPLIMDFYYKGFKNLDKKKVHYNLPPRKTVIDQCLDIYTGIRDYKRISNIRVMEVYPFLGMNPENYNLEMHVQLMEDLIIPDTLENLRKHIIFIRQTRTFIYFRYLDEDVDAEKLLKKQLMDLIKNENDKSKVAGLIEKFKVIGRNREGYYSRNALAKMICKYFGTYNHATYNDFKEKNTFHPWDKAGATTTSFWEIRGFFFSGIKVYPPMGFHPWPGEDDWDNHIKVNLLYQFCEERGIPIVTHCSDGGFKTVVDDIETDKGIASPFHWENVLRIYPKLKLDFAHFGNQASYTDNRWGEWTDKILEFIDNDDYPNVYADLSDIGVKKGRYKKLMDRIIDYGSKNGSKGYYDKLGSHILYGTDFMVNLFHVRSNLEYLEIFDRSKAFDKHLNKDKFCQENPEKFLFG